MVFESLVRLCPEWLQFVIIQFGPLSLSCRRPAPRRTARRPSTTPSTAACSRRTLDDRGDLTVGKKLREASASGVPWVVLFGKGVLAEDGPRVELHDVYSGQVAEVRLEEALEAMAAASSIRL